MECSEEHKRIVKLKYNEWTPLLGKVIKDVLRTNGINFNGDKGTLRIVGKGDKPEIHFTFTTARQLLEEEKKEEENLASEGTVEIEGEFDDLEFLSPESGSVV